MLSSVVLQSVVCEKMTIFSFFTRASKAFHGYPVASKLLLVCTLRFSTLLPLVGFLFVFVCASLYLSLILVHIIFFPFHLIATSPNIMNFRSLDLLPLLLTYYSVFSATKQTSCIFFFQVNETMRMKRKQIEY